jgi:catechol 2,3-dioxygenase-like lactoylglutathione lyase family enzyme
MLPEIAMQGETMEVNGIAHIFLTASNYQRSRDFYRKLLPFLGLKPVIDTETTYYCVGGRTAVGISAPSAEHEGAAFEQKRVGLHHLCFRARERADVDELHGFLQTLGAKIIRAPREDQWAPGYYSILFEDPDGIRLELNHVPGRGCWGSSPLRRMGGAKRYPSCLCVGIDGYRCALPILRAAISFAPFMRRQRHLQCTASLDQRWTKCASPSVALRRSFVQEFSVLASRARHGHSEAQLRPHLDFPL